MDPDRDVDQAVGHDDQHGERQRHQALAGISRSRLLAVLRQSDEPMGVRELAIAVDLHPNTVREHLDRLVAAGLVVRRTAAPVGRGRPGLLYAAEPSSAEADPHAYRALASALAVELAERADGVETAVNAGERWGAQVAGRLDPVDGPAAVLDRLVDLLDQLGFAPERPATAESSIRLRRCPFGSLAHERADVVCSVHLGLMRGALRELGAPLGTVSLEPFVEPDLCLARLGDRAADR